MGSSSTISLLEQRIYYVFVGILSLTTALALYTEQIPLAIAPAAILGLLAIVIDIRFLYYGFFITIPFSIEFQLSSFGTDLPSEPMMLALTGIAIVLGITHLKSIPQRILYHPISVMLCLHILWIFISGLFSEYPTISIKFFLAKLWYVIPFYALSIYILRTDISIYKLFKYVSITLTIAVAFVLVRHAMYGFSFDTSNKVVQPIFRNHVNYAAIVVLVIPYLWAVWKKEKKNWQLVALIILLLGTYFSYTRAAHLCLFIMVGGYFLYKYRLIKLALVGASFIAVIGCTFLLQNNKYLDFAPEYERTIAHKSFDNLVEATYKLEDASTMERVYRWVAGVEMIKRRPVLGYGPGGFYFNYKKYTVSSFETYVSDNPEKSGIHCYYLMTWVEQGVIGFLLFVSICVLIIMLGGRAYQNTPSDEAKYLIIATCLSNLSILALLLINDLIEADKVGPFFFLNAAIIVIYDLRFRKNGKQVATSSKV